MVFTSCCAKPKFSRTIFGELLELFDLLRIPAARVKHARVYGMTRTGQGSGGEGAKAARRPGNQNDFFHDRSLSLGEITVGANDLSVDPTAVRSREKGDDPSNIFGFA